MATATSPSPGSERPGTRSSVSVRAQLRAIRGERLALYLMMAMLAAWIIVSLAIQGVEIAENHDGLGFNQHVPASIVRQIGVGNDLQKMMAKTNKP